MILKPKLIILTASLVFVLSAGVTFAESNVSVSATSEKASFNIDEINKLVRDAGNSTDRKDQQLSNIIKGADMMIANRIATLNNLNSRIQRDARLTTEEKASITADIQNAINGLNTLKATIDADTDVTKVRTDTKLIVTNFRIYEILEPKLRLLITLNNLQTSSAKISTLIPQVQNLNVTEFNSLLSDVSLQLSVINTTISADIATLNAITVMSANPQATFTQIRSDISNIIKTNLVKIRSDFKDMRTVFHQTSEPTKAP